MTSYTQSGQFFFHYTTREAAFSHILPERRLRLSPYSRMRDPLEAKAPALASGLTVPEDPGVQEEMGRAYFEARDEIARLRRQTKLLSLTIDAPGGTRGVRNTIDHRTPWAPARTSHWRWRTAPRRGRTDQPWADATTTHETLAGLLDAAWARVEHGPIERERSRGPFGPESLSGCPRSPPPPTFSL